jgi:hypothetical protein
MNKPVLAGIIFVTACFAIAVAQAPNKFPFKITDMHFNAPPVEREIDVKCLAEGRVTANTPEAQKAQNRAKNNFAVTGDPIKVLVTDFDKLERATEAARKCSTNHGSNCKKLDIDNVSGLPRDRTQLLNITTLPNGQQLGEGTFVSLEAKVLGSHYSNTKFNIYNNNGHVVRGSGESVNCAKQPGFNATKIDSNDIHVVLVAPGVTNECLSVTAEVSPHFRPDNWRRFHNMRKNELGEDINLEAKGVNFNKVQLVRMTGPLFYDASHEPCSPNKRSSPARRSLWEIHPVYKIEVKVNGTWKSFDDWINEGN